MVHFQGCLLKSSVCRSCQVIRADVVRDAEFQMAFLNEYWGGSHFDAGDDCFITRWLQQNSLLIAAQATPETLVRRTVKLSWVFIMQMLRWERSTIQSFLCTLWEVPQIWEKPYVVRFYIQRNIRPMLTSMHLFAWVVALMRLPALAAVLVGVYVYRMRPAQVGFYKTYPWMVKYWWVAVLRDFSYVVQDPLAWCTLNDASWLSGEEAGKTGWVGSVRRLGQMIGLWN